MDKVCLSIRETAQVMDTSTKTVFRLLRDRRLASVLVGKRRKITLKEIDRYMKDNTVPYKLINYRKEARSA